MVELGGPGGHLGQPNSVYPNHLLWGGGTLLVPCASHFIRRDDSVGGIFWHPLIPSKQVSACLDFIIFELLHPTTHAYRAPMKC